jgi:hypothetical protein
VLILADTRDRFDSPLVLETTEDVCGHTAIMYAIGGPGLAVFEDSRFWERPQGLKARCVCHCGVSGSVSVYLYALL